MTYELYIHLKRNVSCLIGIATRQCNVEGIWEPPNLINCTTEAFLNASSEVRFHYLRFFFKMQKHAQFVHQFYYSILVIQLDTILEDGITNPEKTSETIDNTLHLMNNLTSSTPELSAGDISSSIDILEKIVNVTNNSGSSIAKEVYFVCLIVWFFFSNFIAIVQ